MITYYQTDLTIYCSFFLFQYKGEFVEINLVGALVPILISLLVLVLLKGRNLGRIAKYSALICGLYTLVWTMSDAVAGGISTPGSLVVVLFYTVSFTWLYFNQLSITERALKSILLQTYATGTFGVFFADMLRMSASLFGIPFLGINAPLGVLGGAGPEDGVLLGGMYYFVFLLSSWMLLRILKIRYGFEFGRRPKDYIQQDHMNTT